MESFLITGLGNPGILYKNTRHNIGFKAIESLAKKYSLVFKKNKKLKSLIAEGIIFEKKVILQLPQTYMNESGSALRLVKDFYKINLENILVVVDDADINFEEFRIKEKGSSAGHNGLKNIEENLNTKDYARLKFGIGKEENLKSFVLKRFDKKETKILEELLDKAIKIIELWLTDGITKAQNFANVKIKKDKSNNEDKNE
ncbi:MAG: Peptidyl-tRNA hydrolase [Candidatus Anoxychlamydiales bacterium]|nr:Peptidyl-tRNA hydrolase [Candidatus Anoxychlamydiales bacterium]